MGSSINYIIPKERDYTIKELKLRLDAVSNRLKTEISYLKEYGNFVKNVNENWFVNLVPAELNEPEYIMGEGGSFDICIYKNVAIIGCMERFGSLYFKEKNLSEQLLKIITEIAKEFGDSNKILIGAGGIGITDYVIDMAYYENADFDQICSKMVELNGAPAKKISELIDKSWYLK